MKQNKFLFILFMALTACVAALLFFQRPSPSIHAKLFCVDVPEDIDKVIIKSTYGSTELFFTNNKWNVNGKEADLQQVKVFFAAWIQAEPRRKITGASADSLRAKKGLEVEFFQNNKSMKKFRVVGNEEETYFVQGDDVYLAAIPGYRVALYPIFAMDEAEWRKKRIFDFNWAKFKTLQAKFPNSKDNFTISFTGKYVGVTGMQADTAQLNNYLDAISLLEAVRFLKKGEIAAPSKPVATLEVTDIKEATYVLTIFSEAQNNLYLAQIGTEFLWLDTQAWNRVRTNREWFVQH